jgi:hypothetical protein
MADLQADARKLPFTPHHVLKGSRGASNGFACALTVLEHHDTTLAAAACAAPDADAQAQLSLLFPWAESSRATPRVQRASLARYPGLLLS